MTLQIPDDIFRTLELDPSQLLVELAIHLFDENRLSLHEGARLAGMTRAQFEDELHDRRIPIHRLDLDDLKQDMEALRNFRSARG